MKKGLQILLCVLLIFSMTACGNSKPAASAPAASGNVIDGIDLGEYSASNPLIIRLATFDKPNDNPITTGNGIILGQDFIDRIKAKFGDAVQVDFYTGGTMGQDGEIFESLSAGTLQMSITTGGTLTNWVNEFKLLDLPYLFEDWSQVMTFRESDVVDEFVKAVHEQVPTVYCAGIKCAGPRNVANNTRPIKSVEDRKGLQIRVMPSDTYLKTFTAMGAIAVPLPGGEVVTALQQGTVDGEENNPVADYSNGFNEVTKYYSEIQHCMMFETLCYNADFLDSLPPSLKQALLDIAHESLIETTKMQEERCDKCIDGIANDYKNQVIRVEDLDIQSFKDACASVYASVDDPNGLVQKIQALK